LVVLALLATCAGAFAACSSSPSASAPASDAGSDASMGEDSGTAMEAAVDTGHDARPVDAGVDAPPSFCQALKLSSRAFVTTGSGTHRGDVAGDFTLALVDGSKWTFSAQATGCETYVFVPDTLTVSQSSTQSIWASDLAALVQASPKNVQYFFVSLQGTDALAKTSTDAMQAQIAGLSSADSGLGATDAAYWKPRLHVVAGRGATYGNWVGTVLGGWGQVGITIDRRQRLRSLGFLSDVTRQDPANSWPFDINLAYAANEALYMNAESDELDRLDGEKATVVTVFDGGVLQGQGYATVQMPASLASFDTLEVEVTMACPDPTAVEFNSCGAWDYIASLYLDTPDLEAGAPEGGSGEGGGGDAGPPVTETELARFITSYHRESHWVEDISPMLGLLPSGGTTALHYTYAPSWNVQPTAVTMTLRFSSQKKGYVPSTLTPIATGGTWNDMYNAGRAPVAAPIPADTKHAEVWLLVTGHGSDNYQCAEFCDSQHVFTVGGASNTWTVDFPMAGTEQGCMTEVAHGMTPNQGGTWWYGRDGWCPGEEVTPHVWDVTSLVTPGSMATVTYQGQYGGATPPSGGTGNIVLTSYLVTYH
jgi:hypothetical protein